MRKISFIILALLLVAGCGRYEDEYNEAGKITKEYCYDKEGDYSGYYIYEYDSSGLLEKKTEYDKDDNEVKYIEYKLDFYSDGGFTNFEYTYTPDGKLTAMESMTFDSSGKKIDESNTEYN